MLTGEMEKRYLAGANYPLKHVAIFMLDLGLRNEEALSLRKSDVTDSAVTIQGGKTDNARRAVPQTSRTREVFSEIAEFYPDTEWVFPGHKKGTHLTRGAVDNLHTRRRDALEMPKDFVLYSCRHTYGTRLAESGGTVWDIKRLMGHSSINVSQRYIHPSAEGLELASKRKELYDRMLRGEVQETASTASKARI